jgi:hypothetical protein
MNTEISANMLKALLIICKRLEDINLNLNNINHSLQVMSNPKQEETN